MAGDRAGQLDLFASGELNIDDATVIPAVVSPIAPVVMQPATVVIEEGKGAPAGVGDVPRQPRPTSSPDRMTGIQDAGTELIRNRRNLVRGARSWADLSVLNDALKVKETTKANVWPRPDYTQLIADGMPPLVAHLVKQVYDSLAAKPVPAAGGVLDDARLQNYVGVVNRVEHGLMEWAMDGKAVQAWAKANARLAGAMLGQIVAITDLAPAPTLLEAVFPDGWRANRAAVMVAGGNRLLEALQPGYAEIQRASKALKVGWPEKREAWEIQGFRVEERPEIEVLHQPFMNGGQFVVWVGQDCLPGGFGSHDSASAAAALIKPFVLFDKRRLVGSFDSHDEAVAIAKESTSRDKSGTVSEAGKKVESIEREGVARRLEAEDISSERLRAEFGFKGVNFGNWMKTPSARAEAQLHLNHAFDSLHDLAALLNVPPRALSLNGMLGLAIGAQGVGGTAAAHFVAGVNEINLTRTSGAGSLAHEWGHALDHYFATQAGLAAAAEPFLTEHVGGTATRSERVLEDGKWVAREVPRFTEIRPEIVKAFSAVVAKMNKREQTPEEATAAAEASLKKSEWNRDSWLKSFGSDFEREGIGAEFGLLATRVRAGDVGDGMVAVSRSAYLSPVVVEIRDLYKAKTGRLYSLDQCKGLQWNIDAVKHQEGKRIAAAGHEAPGVEAGERVVAQVPTAFAANAVQLDKDKGGKPYWSTKLEKFARAFDAFVSDEMEGRGIRNGYLSHQGREGVTVPMGAERRIVNEAFRGLVGEVKSRETERGVALFSLGGRTTAKAVGMDGASRAKARADEVEASPAFKPVDVQAPEFRRWFGASKVVGEDDGAPKRMYHGTLVWSKPGGQAIGDIETFDRLKTRELFGRKMGVDSVGSWFSDNPGTNGAGMYVDGMPDDRNAMAMYPVYLSIKNPWTVTFEGMVRTGNRLLGRAPGTAPDIDHVERMRQWLADQGKDGIRLVHDDWAENHSTEFKHQDVWIALEPTQIKSAISNSMEFSSVDPSILHSQPTWTDIDQCPAGMPQAMLQAMVRDMRTSWPSMPAVTVVQSAADLPFAAHGHADGCYTRHDGHAYVIAENVCSTEQFYKVMAHECVLHHSLEDMLGPYGFSKLHEGVQALKESGDPVVTALAADIRERYGVLPPKDETREIVALAGEQCLDSRGELKVGFGFMKGVFAGVVNWLRDIGIKVPFTNLEVQGLMHEAGQWVKRDQSLSLWAGTEKAGAASPRGDALEGGRGVLHSFGGIRAAGAPIDRLRVAREMQCAGIEDRVIWNETGWTFGFADGKPRFEIADAGAVVEPAKQGPDVNDLDAVARQLYGVSYSRLPFADDGTLGEERKQVKAGATALIKPDAELVAGNMKNAALLDHYPQVAGLSAWVHVTDDGQCKGGYSPMGITASASRQRITGVVLHELQHAVQAVEGFAVGGNPDNLKDIDLTDRVLSEINGRVHALYSANPAFYAAVVVANQKMDDVRTKYGSLAEYDIDDPLVKAWWAAIEERDEFPENRAWLDLKTEEYQVARDRVVVTAFEHYHRLAGEVEARLTDARGPLSIEERAAQYPVDAMDVKVADQFVVLPGRACDRVAVREGTFSGRVLDVDDGIVVQKVGRGEDEVVRHSLSRLTAAVAIGDVVDIVYQEGKGVVKGAAVGVER